MEYTVKKTVKCDVPNCPNGSKASYVFYIGSDINRAYGIMAIYNDQYRNDGCGCQVEIVENET